MELLVHILFSVKKSVKTERYVEKKTMNEELDLQEIKKKLYLSLDEVSSAEELELLRIKWLGTKGILKNQFKKMEILSKEDKIEVAKILNQMKSELEEWILKKRDLFLVQARKKEVENEYIDFSLCSKNLGLGSVHPIRIIERRITKLLKPFGFEVVEGPEIETEYYCFDALNIPKHHPARDMQDTFYINPEGVLRTHTTSVQSRELEKHTLPLKVISCGRVYRNEAEDSSHQSMFHQYELVWVEEGLVFSNLLALLQHVLHGLFGKERKVRFVPKYYPYTTPSIGAQIDCLFCNQQGCSFCKGSGWVTIVGAGMIHENVLKEFLYDPKKVTGLAFGFGSCRLATQFFQFPHIKSLYVNDMRLLRSLV